MRGISIPTIFVILAIATSMPFLASTYAVSLLNQIFVYIILSVSFDFLMGYAGYANLGHSGFFGVGAYAFAIAYSRNLGVGLSLVLSFGFPALIALGLSYPFFRLKGAYFAIATMALTLLLYALAFNLGFLTRGYQGLSIETGNVLIQAYYLLLLSTCLTLLTSRWIAKSKLGLFLQTIKGDEEVAMSVGIDVFRCKALTLVISSILAGLAGGLFAWYNGYITPEGGFGILITFLPLVMALFGGSGTIVGPPAGAIAIATTLEFFSIRLPYFQLIIIGALLIAVGLLMPTGAVGTLSRIKRSVTGRLDLFASPKPRQEVPQ